MTELTPREKREQYRQLLAARVEEENALKRAQERVLADAEWYMLSDRRELHNFFFWRVEDRGGWHSDNSDRQYDADPAVSEKLRKATSNYQSSIKDPEFLAWSAPNSDREYRRPLFWYTELPFPAELVPRRTAVRMKAPKHPLHYECVTNFAAEHWRKMWIVSDAWKRAIEDLEPAVHEFFSHEIQFDDVVLTNFWVIRRNYRFDPLDHERSELDELKEEVDIDSLGWPFDEDDCILKDENSRRLFVRRKAIEGKHWISNGPYVSRSLAVKLNPLLPSQFPDRSTIATRFFAVSVSD
jgi:hypothetical protein